MAAIFMAINNTAFPRLSFRYRKWRRQCRRRQNVAIRPHLLPPRDERGFGKSRHCRVLSFTLSPVIEFRTISSYIKSMRNHRCRSEMTRYTLSFPSRALAHCFPKCTGAARFHFNKPAPWSVMAQLAIEPHENCRQHGIGRVDIIDIVFNRQLTLASNAWQRLIDTRNIMLLFAKLRQAYRPAISKRRQSISTGLSLS